MCLACLNIGSYAAFGAFIALAFVSLYTSYFIAIACMLRARLRNEVTFGTWFLGVIGTSVNAYALLYTAWMMVITCFPQYLPVTGDNFNYASPIFGVALLFAAGLWVVRAKKHWPGLNKEVIDIVLKDSDRDTVD